MQKVGFAFALLILHLLKHVELKHTTKLSHHKGHTDLSNNDLAYKRNKGVRKALRINPIDDDEERNITVLYDRVGSFPYQQKLLHHTATTIGNGSSHKHYHPSKYTKKRPMNLLGTKRNLHGFEESSIENPSISTLFSSSSPLGTPLGRLNNVPIEGNLPSPLHDEVPLAPVSTLMNGGGVPIPQPIQGIPFGNSEPDMSSYITPHQTTYTSQTKHVYQQGLLKQQVGFSEGGFLQKHPAQMTAPTVDQTEDVSNAIVPHQTVYSESPKHIYQPGLEKTQSGFVPGGFLQKYPASMRAQGFHHIIHKPIHIMDPHATTSYETLVEQGTVHDHPCLNGGVYFLLAGHYQCICPEEFIGKNCQEKNFCHPCPCRHKGICHNIRDDPFYKCHCKVGSYGIDCEKKDPCYPNPCKNQGVCTHDGSIASCICTQRFRGAKCESLNNCNPDPCKNGGTCIELKGEGKFQCDCLPMYRGSLCGGRSYCFINPCRNGGTCREGNDRFICDCPKGFTGPACADLVCQPNPCMNGGTCIEDGDLYKCVCLPWTTGNLCEETRPCLTKPCMHDGRCIDSYSGFHWSFGPLQYYCVCKTPYKGMNCEHHACQNCHKNAHCDVDHCVCDEGYEGNGQSCRKVDNPCFPNPCMNKGVCTEVQDYCSGDICGFKCACPDPYLPPLCKNKNPCDPDPCVNGVCVPLADGTSTCQCEPGYRGPSCADKDACHPNPCQHRGACKDLNGTASCSCPGEWKPPYCKECGCPYKSADGAPTQLCSPEGACICPVGYNPNMRSGTCEKQQVASAERRPCQSNPCENGGTCMDINDVDYSCLCSKGTSGKVCQHKSACNPGPCLNGGTCREDDGKFLGCDCPPHFSPPLCKKPQALSGPCQPNPCLQGGICIANRGAYDCLCAARFTGPHCNVDKCAHCDIHAKCINGHCKCATGYVGNGYTCERETCEQTCVEWSTCVDGQCQCHPGYAYVYNKCVPTPLTTGKGEEEDEEHEITHPQTTHPISGIEEGTGPDTLPVVPTIHPKIVPTSRPDIILPHKGNGNKVVKVETTEPPLVLTTPVLPKEPPTTFTKPPEKGPPGKELEGDEKLGPPGISTDGDMMKGPPGSRRMLFDDQDEEDDAFAEPKLINTGRKHRNTRKRRFVLNY